MNSNYQLSKQHQTPLQFDTIKKHNLAMVLLRMSMMLTMATSSQQTNLNS